MANLRACIGHFWLLPEFAIQNQALRLGGIGPAISARCALQGSLAGGSPSAPEIMTPLQRDFESPGLPREGFAIRQDEADHSKTSGNMGARR
ncbi:hypothetical protein [Labrys okinawensis]|uniref:hypothetical protein n=1 Tax=Labrys okinawensis TaxID=346911 RepID=UPI0011B1DB81|nr:hypothetical protein [Labrys okinawensis]